MSILAEPAVRVRVVVTFLRMDEPPASPAPVLPPGVAVHYEPNCSVERYRLLYDTVGAEYCWWLRRTMPDSRLAAMLRDPRISVYMLTVNGAPGGFYELDRSGWPTVNLNYFGLMPQAVGRGFGLAFLRHAVDSAWGLGARAMTVNTCTADHPRALPTYLRAGFVIVRQIAEDWKVPARLGLEIPARLRG
jgi:hypothetical protein